MKANRIKRSLELTNKVCQLKEEVIVRSSAEVTINDMYDYIKTMPPIMSSHILVPTTHQVVHQELF